jgi:hypothetical protein
MEGTLLFGGLTRTAESGGILRLATHRGGLSAVTISTSTTTATTAPTAAAATIAAWPAILSRAIAGIGVQRFIARASRTGAGRRNGTVAGGHIRRGLLFTLPVAFAIAFALRLALGFTLGITLRVSRRGGFTRRFTFCIPVRLAIRVTRGVPVTAMFAVAIPSAAFAAISIATVGGATPIPVAVTRAISMAVTAMLRTPAILVAAPLARRVAARVAARRCGGTAGHPLRLAGE